MSIFGPDVSSYQHGINIRALPDPFVLLKCTEGTYYTDADYENWLAQAKASGKLVVPYHFVSGEDPDAQAAHLLACIVDKTLPVMLDWEPTATYRPTLAQLLAVADALVRKKLRPKLAYAPRWYWTQIGSPSLGGLTARGIGLVSSAYPGGSAYPGDNAAGWSPYGGVTPTLYQFTDSAVEGGQTVGDRNAYRGTVDQLAAFLGATSPPAPSSTPGADMALTDIVHFSPGLVKRYPELAGEGFGTEAPLETVLGWMAGRTAHLADTQDAVVAAAVVPIKAELDLVKSAIAALPDLINTHVANGATADQLAEAVVQHLGTTLSKG